MLGAGALGPPRGMVWGGRREEGSGWGTHVYLGGFILMFGWRDWGQEEKGMTEDEMAGWHHQLDGHEFE